MYSIAICDDDRDFACMLKDLCSDVLEKSEPFRISLYSSAAGLYKAFTDGEQIDLLILDIKLGEKNGIELARILRSKGFETSIILMSSDASYLLDGYTVQPIYFLLKPITREKLESALLADIERRVRRGTVCVKCGVKRELLTIDSIIYLEVMDHVLTVHTRAGDYVSGTTLSRLMEALPQDAFSRCHKSFAVNLSFVKSFSRTDGAVLDNSVTVPIGRKYFSDFRRSMIEYLNR